MISNIHKLLNTTIVIKYILVSLSLLYYSNTHTHTYILHTHI